MPRRDATTGFTPGSLSWNEGGLSRNKDSLGRNRGRKGRHGMERKAGMEKKEIREAMLRMEAARKRILHPYFQKVGLTPGQPRILNKLFEADHVSQRELADRCNMDVATLSRSLDKLEEAGYVSRQKHPDCRRSFLIVLTEEGRKKAGEVHENFSRMDDQIWKDISEAEMEGFLACAEKIIRNLEDV